MKKSFGIVAVIACVLLAGCKSSSSAKEGNGKNFEVLAVRDIKSNDDYLKGFVKDSQKKAGIAVKWTVQQGSDWSDKKSVFLTNSEDLPDAFFGGNALTDADIQKNQGLFIPLEKLIDKNMPNLKKIMASDPKVKSLITSDDGHIYSLPKKMPGRPIVGNQLFINQVWLNNLNLQMPTTYEELEAILQKFKTQDPNKNGKQDEIPLLGGIDRLLTIYGVQLTSSSTTFMNWDPATKKVVYNPITDSYKNAMNSFNKLFKEGLLYNEQFTADDSQIGSKRMNDSIALVGVSDGWLPTAFGSHSDEYVPLPALTAPDGKKYVMMDQDPYGRNQFVVTNKCKNPGKLLKWIDQFYTDDASVETYYGDFGTGSEKNADGTYTILPGKDMAQSSYSEIIAFRDQGPKYVADGFSDKLQFKTLDGDGLKLKITKDLEPYAVENYPQVMYTNDEQAKLSTLTTDIDGYVKNKQAEWISKNGVSDKEWSSYLKQLDQMGMTSFLKIHQDAITRYEKNAK